MSYRVLALFLAIGLGVTASPDPARAAQNTVTVYAGGQFGFSNYGYLGGTFALPGSSIGNGFAIRTVGFTGGYDYLHSSTLVHAYFSGAEVDALYQFSSKDFWNEFSAGARYADTSLSPYDPTNRRRGSQVEFAAGVDGGTVSGPWRVDWYGSYGTFLEDYAARLSLTHTLAPGVRFGAEGYAEGDPTYDLRQVGPYLGIGLGANAELQFSGGFSWQTGRGSRPYLRASVYSTF